MPLIRPFAIVMPDELSSTSIPAFCEPVAPVTVSPVRLMSCWPEMMIVLPPEAGRTCTVPGVVAQNAIGAPALPDRVIVKPE